MTLYLDLGDNWRLIDWKKKLDEFPKVVRLGEKKYEWQMYDHGTGMVDYELHFSELKSSDYSLWTAAVDLDDIEKYGSVDCCCGAHHTSFSNIHMLYCPLWRKVP